MAVASALMNALRTGQPMPVPVPDPGRANVVACGRYLPGNPDSCAAATDPREPGLAFGGTQ
jgi:gamma-glutamyltranspeptidase/glutathione hydrolase